MKKYIKKIFSNFGYDLINKQASERQSLKGALQQIKKNWTPEVVIDVGAAFGTWTKECYKIFPKAQYLLIEPLTEYNRSLDKLKNEKNNIITINTAANSTTGTVFFNMHKDLVGSSLKNEIEGQEVDGKKIEVKSITLDDACMQNNLSGDFLIKIDVQGAELDVLEGAKNIFDKTECIILEVSLFKSFINGHDLFDIISYMKNIGFVPYDIFGFLYRPYDNALCQVDIVFVKTNSNFRKFQGYASKEQREKQNEKFEKKIDELL